MTTKLTGALVAGALAVGILVGAAGTVLVHDARPSMNMMGDSSQMMGDSSQMMGDSSQMMGDSSQMMNMMGDSSQMMNMMGNSSQMMDMMGDSSQMMSDSSQMPMRGTDPAEHERHHPGTDK